MCFYNITRYTCSAESAQLLDKCAFEGTCLPHIYQIQDTSAVCDLCAQAFRWSEHSAVLQWWLIEREMLEKTEEGGENGDEEVFGVGGEDLNSTVYEGSDVEQMEGAEEDESEGAGQAKDVEGDVVELAGVEFNLSQIPTRGEVGGGRARGRTF